MFRTKFIPLLVSLFLVLAVKAQHKDIRFKRITINDGLSLSSVYCIFQDSKGFMWFGTEDGLNRYDGKNFIIYRNDPGNTNSISYKWIEQIVEDSMGNLWFGSRGGLSRFNPINETFENFRGVGPNKQLSNDTITHIFEDSNQKLWVGTLKGINCIDIKSRKVLEVKNKQLLDSRVNCFLEQQNGFWIGTNTGLYYYDRNRNSFWKTNFTKDKNIHKVTALARVKDSLYIGTENSLYSLPLKQNKNESATLILSGPSVENILVEKTNDLWISTSKALIKREAKSGEIIKVVKSFESTNSLSINTNKPIIKNKNGEIWFGTYGSGLYRLLPKKKEKLHYKSSTADAQSLSQNSINCIYEDKSGVIWIGTFGAGISIYDPQSHKFELFKNNALDSNSLASNFIWTICEDKEGDIWIGTNDKGISRYSFARDTFYHYDFRKSKKGAHTAIRKVFEDRDGNIWIGTDGDGLIRYNRKKRTSISFKHNSKDSSSISHNSVRAIFEDSEGLIWVGTRDGLNLYQPKTDSFKQFKYNKLDPKSISHNFVYSSIYEDSKGLIWIGTYGGGLNAYNKKDGTFKRYQYSTEENGISDDVVFSIYEDKAGILWIGTNNKLNRFDPVAREFSYFGTEEGLPNNVVYGILPDDHENLWLSTNSGICKFSLNDYSVSNFDVHDGLQSKEFNGGAYHKGKSGNLYFGGVYGLNIINPNDDFPEEGLYDVVLTKLEIHGQEVIVDNMNRADKNKIAHSDTDDNYYFSKSIPFTDEIELDFEDRFISLEFSSLSNFSPDKVNYAYRLKGLEEKWVYSGKRNYVSYSNLSPGNYLFQVHAQNPNGKWSAQPKELTITILAPFYMTWWFIVVALVLLNLIFFYVYRSILNIKTNKILTAQNEKIKVANQQLRVSENNLKELVATKDKFFRIISHDLKNPFTSLLSISEMIHENYDQVDEDEKQTGIKKIHESVKHIFTLLENLLTWSRSQTGKIDYAPEEFYLSKLISESVRLYSASAEKKQIRLHQTCSPEIKVLADRNMCSAVMRNLLNNAIKFSNPDSEIKVEVEPNGKFYEVKVIDQGIGIAPENLDKLFRIDLKYKSQGTSGEKGTGLGLLLCKEFAETNGGKIWVESTPSVGSTFSFLIPSA